MNLPSPKNLPDACPHYSCLAVRDRKYWSACDDEEFESDSQRSRRPHLLDTHRQAITSTSARNVWCPALVCLCSALFFLLGRYLPAVPRQHGRLERLQHRQDTPTPACGGGMDGTGDTEYNTPLHVGALFIILFVSTSACAFPILALRVSKLRIPRNTIFAIRHFGTGVLLATAFVHLLPTAFLNLGNPCLGQFWTKDYPAMPGAIALGSILILIVIEMLFSPARLLAKEDATTTPSNDRTARPSQVSIRTYSGRATSLARSPNPAIPADDDDDDDSTVPTPATITTNPTPSKLFNLTPDQERKRQLTQCVLLECSILFHSIFIGLALGVALGPDFIVLLIAIVFHQTFEGLALGARIAGVGWPANKRFQPWLMALAYGCTTPLGQAVGLATHTLYSPDSRVGLLVVGVFNAISAGLLAYASLVELLAEDFLSDQSWRDLRGRRRVVGFGLVVSGCVGMGVVGAFA